LLLLQPQPERQLPQKLQPQPERLLPQVLQPQFERLLPQELQPQFERQLPKSKVKRLLQPQLQLLHISIFFLIS